MEDGKTVAKRKSKNQKQMRNQNLSRKIGMIFLQSSLGLLKVLPFRTSKSLLNICEAIDCLAPKENWRNKVFSQLVSKTSQKEVHKLLL